MSDSKQLDTTPFQKLYKEYTAYFEKNKGNFDRLLEMARKDNANFKQYYADEAQSNIDLMGEMRETKIFVYKKLLDDNGINDGTADFTNRITNSSTYKNLMNWYKEMNNCDQVLRRLAKEINDLRR